MLKVTQAMTESYYAVRQTSDVACATTSYGRGKSHDHVHWIELFYDLIHVVIVFLLGNFLSDHLTLSGFVVFAGIFIAIWLAGGLPIYF